MIRRYLPRIPLLRSFFPRVSLPVLPLTSRLRLSSSYTSLTNNPRLSNIPLHNNFHARHSSSSSLTPPPPQTQLPPEATLSQRLKHLIKRYGWYALGVYVILSVLDFGVAFAAVNLLGAQQVSQLAASVKSFVVRIIHSKPSYPGENEVEPTARSNGQEGLYAMLLLAWTVHKTLFLPVRVGLTAGLTPKLVSWLATRGWTGGEGTRRAALEMREKMRRNRD